MFKNIYTKVSFNFIKKHLLIYSLVLMAIIISVFAVFVPYVTAKSQSINYKKVVENVYPDFPAMSNNATSQEANLIKKNENVSKSIKYENDGFFTSNKSKIEYKLFGYNKEALTANNYILSSGNLPKK